MPMNPNAGRRTAVEGLVSQVLSPSQGPKSAKGYPQYTITLTQATNFFETENRPSDNDVVINIIEGWSEEGDFGRSLIEVLGSPDEQQLQGKWVRLKYSYREGSNFATRTVEAVSETPFK